MMKLRNSNYDKTTQNCDEIQNSNYDETQTQMVTKHKTQIVTKLKINLILTDLKNSNCDKTQIVTKIKYRQNPNGDETQKLEW